LTDIERPLLPKVSYLLKKYGENKQDILNMTNASRSIHEMSVLKEDFGDTRVSARVSNRSSHKSVISNPPEKLLNLGTSSKTVKGLKQAI
jgi:hypothetical protein